MFFIDLCNFIINGFDLFLGVLILLESCKKKGGGGILIDYIVLVFIKWKDDIKLVRIDCMYKFLDSNKWIFMIGV